MLDLLTEEEKSNQFMKEYPGLFKPSKVLMSSSSFIYLIDYYLLKNKWMGN